MSPAPEAKGLGPRSNPRWIRWALSGLAVLATLGVFALYQRPDFLVMLADQAWACF